MSVNRFAKAIHDQKYTPTLQINLSIIILPKDIHAISAWKAHITPEYYIKN